MGAFSLHLPSCSLALSIHEAFPRPSSTAKPPQQAVYPSAKSISATISQIVPPPQVPKTSLPASAQQTEAQQTTVTTDPVKQAILALSLYKINPPPSHDKASTRQEDLSAKKEQNGTAPAQQHPRESEIAHHLSSLPLGPVYKVCLTIVA